MKPLRLPTGARAKIPTTTNTSSLLRAWNKYAMTSEDRKAIIRRAEELSMDLPVKEVSYV